MAIREFNIFAAGLFPTSNRKLLAYLCRRFRVFMFTGQAFKPEFGPGPELVEEYLTENDLNADTKDMAWEMHRLLSLSQATARQLIPGDASMMLDLKDFDSIYPLALGAMMMGAMFSKLADHVRIDLVICNGDYSGARRPVVIEAKRLGIPTLDIEHGFFAAAPLPHARAENSATSALMFLSDFVNLDNQFERDYWQAWHKFAGRTTETQFIVNGTPNDHSCNPHLSKTDGLHELGLAEGKFTITIASSWLEAHVPAAAIDGQVQHVEFFRSALAVAAEIKKSRPVQIIVKMHPAFGVRGGTVWEDTVRFLKHQIRTFGSEIDLIILGKLSEVIAASDLLICPSASSLVWEFFLASKPSLVLYTPIFYDGYFDRERLNDGNTLFERKCMEFVFSEEELRDRVLNFMNPVAYQEFQARAKGLAKEKGILRLTATQKCQNICNWIEHFLRTGEGHQTAIDSPAMLGAGEASPVDMDAQPKSEPERRTLITGVRPDHVGVYVSVICDRCGHYFEHFLPTVAGHGVGRFPCTQCDADHVVWPEQFLAAVENFIPKGGLEAETKLVDEVTRVTESWYKHPEFVQVLTYRNVNLGEPSERMLSALVSAGLNLHRKTLGGQK